MRLRKVVSMVAAERERELADVAKEAGAELICGSSLKATLDCDWDQPEQKVQALSQVLSVLQTVEQWFHGLAQEEQTSQAEHYLKTAHQVEEQDIKKMKTERKRFKMVLPKIGASALKMSKCVMGARAKACL